MTTSTSSTSVAAPLVLPPKPALLSRSGWAVFGAALLVLCVLAPVLNLAVPEGSAFHLSDYGVALAYCTVLIVLMSLSTLLVQALATVQGISQEAVRAAGNFAAISAAFVRHYEQRCGTRSHLYPQVREVLQALKGQGVKLAVVTNKEGRYTQVVLEAHALAPTFDRIISGDTLPTKKPTPVGINACLTQFGVDRSRALFVGDSSIDVATARNAGLAVWLLPYGYNMGQPIASSNPDRLIADCTALLNS